MRLRSILTVLLAGVLMSLVTGCFRQASEPFETVNEPLPAQGTLPTGDTGGETGGNTAGTPTFSIPVITSTPITFAEEPTATPPVPTATDAAEGLSATATTEPTLIIPGLPSGPVVTNTPGPTATADTSIPTLEPLETPVDPFAEANADCIHIVAPGDTVFRIAQNNDTTVAAIEAINPDLNPNLIQPGDEILLPDCEPTTSVEAAPPAAPTVAPDVNPPATQSGGTVPIPTAPPLVHIVSAGETLGRIAAQYDVTVLQIVEANNLANPNQLSVGQELIIPPPPAGG